MSIDVERARSRRAELREARAAARELPRPERARALRAIAAVEERDRALRAYDDEREAASQRVADYARGVGPARLPGESLCDYASRLIAHGRMRELAAVAAAYEHATRELATAGRALLRRPPRMRRTIQRLPSRASVEAPDGRDAIRRQAHPRRGPPSDDDPAPPVARLELAALPRERAAARNEQANGGAQ